MSLTPETTRSEPSPGDDAETEECPAPFGQYLLLHLLARGGMGNVFLAKTGGVMGIEKHCVVKTLRRRFTHDPEYVERFMQEARVVVQLSHRNICPVFDVGRVGRSYYLAMELVLGRDVRSVINALIDAERPLSQALSIHIACEVLDALDYAHRHHDNTTGKPLHLVHRDVSPQNVMISIEGEVKLIDFGLAEIGKAPQSPGEQVETSQATVMGKMSYMAPEQARGEPVDARADQFAAAVMTYELLTGQRYYAGLSPDQVWLHAGSGQFKPKELTQQPAELRDALLKALATSRDDRFATCGDFREALLAYARKNDLHAGARELRTLMGEVFIDDLKETRELLQRFAHIGADGKASFLTDPTIESGEVFSIATSAQMRTTFHDPTELVRASGAYPIAPRPSRAPALILAATIGVAMLVAAAALFIVLRDPATVALTAPTLPPPPPPPIVASAPVVPVPAVAPPVTPPTTAAPPTTTVPPTTTGPDPVPATTHTTKHHEHDTKKPTEITAFGDQIVWVAKNCPTLPCTKESQQKNQNLGALTLDETLAFRKTVRACYDVCKSIKK